MQMLVLDSHAYVSTWDGRYNSPISVCSSAVHKYASFKHKNSQCTYNYKNNCPGCVSSQDGGYNNPISVGCEAAA